jgi:hypothetical protein
LTSGLTLLIEESGEIILLNPFLTELARQRPIKFCADAVNVKEDIGPAAFCHELHAARHIKSAIKDRRTLGNPAETMK